MAKVYRCSDCGWSAPAPDSTIRIDIEGDKVIQKCNNCGSKNVLIVDDDRATRFGTTKPAKMFTK